MALEFITQAYKPTDYNGLVEGNHFYSIYQQRPQDLSEMLREIWKMHLPTSLVEFVNKFPTKEVEQEDGFYYWTLVGQRDKNLPLIDAETVDGNTLSGGTFPTTVGKHGERFYMIYDEPLFNPSDVIRGPHDEVHLLIQDMEEVGSLYKYEVELLLDNPLVSVSIDDLKIGSRWVKWYNLVPGTLSYRGSEPYFTSPFKLMNRVSMSRMQYTVPGSSIQKGKNEPLEFGFKTAKGEVIEAWINYLDVEAMYQCEEMFARMLIYGRKNWNSDHRIFNKDKNTKWDIASGAGLFQQMEGSSTHYYNKFDIKQFADQILDQSIGKIERGKRTVDVYTGEFGLIQASEAIRKAGGVLIDNASNNSEFVQKVAGGDSMHSNALKFGFQFVEYEYYNGVRFKFHILPFLDDKVMFPKAPGNLKGTVESYRYLVFNFGGDAGIYKMIPRGAKEEYGVIPGLRDPFSAGGKGKSRFMASRVDGYEVHYAKWGGMMLTDPTKVIDWKLNV